MQGDEARVSRQRTSASMWCSFCIVVATISGYAVGWQLVPMVVPFFDPLITKNNKVHNGVDLFSYPRGNRTDGGRSTIFQRTVRATATETRNRIYFEGAQLKKRERREKQHRRRLQTSEFESNEQTGKKSTHRKKGSRKTRLLYVVTTMREYNNGRRKTKKGSDRLTETVIPVVSESAASMVEHGYDVDVYLICHYQLRPDRYALFQSVLPKNVGFQVWNDAAPLSYNREDTTKTHVKNITRVLARQHRYVVKDKLQYYDFFVCFEDDMLVRGDHIDHYLYMRNQIRTMKQLAPSFIPGVDDRHTKRDEALDNYHGIMSQQQLERMIPGFIRVEVLTGNRVQEFDGIDDHQNGTSISPVDMIFSNDSTAVQSINPNICCRQRGNQTGSQESLPPLSADQLVLWETNIKALGIRQMPMNRYPSRTQLNWVLMLRGTEQAILPIQTVIGDYWSGRDGRYERILKRRAGKTRPAPIDPYYLNNQGGWMGARSQIYEWHTKFCNGGFLPPLSSPHFILDGMNYNVEYFSGGINLVGQLGCALQRIVDISDPQQFSKSLLFHASNNKQKQLKYMQEEGLFSKANTLLGQLNGLRKEAERSMQSINEKK